MDSTSPDICVCKNCENALLPRQRFCPDCGQKAGMHRLTLHEIGHETLHALIHVDRSILSLMRQLALQPGTVALDYVRGRRKRYYGPFGFLVVVVAIASAAIAATGFSAVTSDGPNAVVNFLQHHVNILFFVQVPIQAAMLRVLTPRGAFNYAEYLVLIAYTAGMHILFFTVVDVGGWYVFRPGDELARTAYLAMFPLAPLYLGFACSQFIPGSRWLSALKGVAASLLTIAITQKAVDAAVNISHLLPRH